MPKQINIAHIVHSMNVAGAEKVVYDITTGLNGVFKFSVLCLDSVGPLGEELRQRGVQVKALGRNPGVDFSLIGKLAREIRENTIDVIHAHQYTPYFYGVTAAMISGRCKVIFTEHGRHYPDRRRIKRVIFNQFLNLFTRSITGVSEFSKNSLVEYEVFPKDKIKVIYNGIQPEFFDLNIDVEAKKQELGLNPKDKIIGIIARLEPVKDHAMLLRAFAQVVKEITQVKLLIVGDGKLRVELEDLAKVLNINNNVKFLGVRRDIPELLKIFDVFVLSSLSEATSVTLLEVMAAGVPIVATNVGGNPEIVLEGKTGLLVPRGDNKAMARALIKILNNPDKAKKMGFVGKERVDELFTLDQMLKAYSDLYFSLVDNEFLVEKK